MCLGRFFHVHKRFTLSILFLFLFSTAITFATPPSSPYSPGETLDPSCAPGATNCSVQILPSQTGNNGKFLTTDGSSTSWATIPGVSSQWTTTGSDIYFNTGNVGIGTDSPTATLELGSQDTISTTFRLNTYENDNAFVIYDNVQQANVFRFKNNTPPHAFLLDETGAGYLFGIGTSSPDTSSVVDITSTSRGLLIPRMTETQKHAITSPADGLIIYQTDNAKGIWYHDNSADEWHGPLYWQGTPGIDTVLSVGQALSNDRVIDLDSNVLTIDNGALEVQTIQGVSTIQSSASLAFISNAVTGLLLDSTSGDYALGDINGNAENQYILVDDTQHLIALTAQNINVNGKIAIYNGVNVGTNTFLVGDGSYFQEVSSAAARTAIGAAAFSHSHAASDITSGTLSIARGGTNSAATLNNNRLIQSSGGALVEASAITASRALVSDTNGIPTHSSVTATELGYVSGVTSAIQTQLTAKASSSHTHAASDITSGVLAATYGGTGINNGSNTITLGGNITTASSFTTSGANALTLTTTGTTNITLPTTGTLATLAGTENLSNKTFTTRLNTLATTEQFRNQYDTSNYLSVTTASTGSTTFALTGSSPTFTFSQGSTFSAGLTSSRTSGAQLTIVNSATNTTFTGDSSGNLTITGNTGIPILPVFATNTTYTNSAFYANDNYGSSSSSSVRFTSTTAVYYHILTRTSGSILLPNGNGGAAMIMGTNTFTTPGSGVTNPLVAQLAIKPLSISVTSGTITNSASLYLEDAATGATSNYALWSDAGYNRFDGNTSIGSGAAATTYTLEVGSSIVSGIVARFQNSSGTCDINPTTTSLSCSSDERLKRDIAPLPGDTILSKLTELAPVTYRWNADTPDAPLHTGFIAQEVETVFPDLVTHDETTDLLSLNYIGLIPYLVEGIKEMDLKVQSLGSLDTQDKDSLASRIQIFLADAANGIQTLFAQKVRTNELCVGSVCVTEQEFLNIVTDQRRSHGGGGDVAPSVIEETQVVPLDPVSLPKAEADLLDLSLEEEVDPVLLPEPPTEPETTESIPVEAPLETAL